MKQVRDELNHSIENLKQALAQAEHDAATAAVAKQVAEARAQALSHRIDELLTNDTLNRSLLIKAIMK